MEAILPFKIKNEQKYFQSALKLGFDEMEIYKFIYVMQQSDMEIFPRMHDERINVLIYCWELCEDYKNKLSPDEWELPEELETILKLLVPWSLDIWFSKEWEKCKSFLKQGLIHCLNRARDLMMRMPDMMQINWDFLLLYNLTPWNVAYLRNLNVTKEKTLETGAQSIETEEQPANSDDLSYAKLEQLPLIVLRLIKLFDQCSIDMVKTLCMRVIAAWNKIYQIELQTTRRPPYIPPEDKRCLLLICHIYLMAVYESDDVKGYVIDNMIHNIRFYFQGFQTTTALYAMDNLEYTPARFIALTTIHLRLKKSEFFDFFIWNSYDTSLVNLFGVVSQAYKSYLLGNLLMELNNMNEDDFALNVPLYKRLMNSYVNEREKSELFLLKELEKLEIQRYAHNIPTVKSMTDFKSKICKGNRMSNIGNYENSDEIIAPAIHDAVNDVKRKVTLRTSIKEEDEGETETSESFKDKESDLRLDPIFQNIPNNESILYYAYEVLSKKDYKGWHFAKIVLLVKIIGHELNMIETWRYHPGLTTDFMLNLETKLSNHYADLAKIFKDHAFIEQEFWLTAFYLNPVSDTYETIKRLGMRNNRKRTDEQTKLVMSIDNIDAKYGLLSSTIDVKEIANLANTEEPDGDYDPLFSALKSLHLPDSLIKDMLTAIFLPRNRNFAWIVDWAELRTRCKVLLNNSKEKKRFVELNMAEANERLKFLNIDYEKYKNRPQLDYGTIEAGYENLMNSADFDRSDDDDDEDEEDFEDDEDVYESARSSRGRGAAVNKKEEEKNEDENSQEEDPYLTGKRRTRARVAATVASYLFQSIPRATRRRRNKNNELVSKDEYEDEKTKANNEKDNVEDNEKDMDDKSNDSKSPITTSEFLAPSLINDDTKDSDDPDIIKKNIKECLNERPSINNSTPYFQPLIDIWNVEKSDMQSIDNNCVSLLESSMVLRRMAKLKLLNKQTNPLGCNEHEAIDETEMLIINTDFPMTKFTSTEKETKHMVVNSSSETIFKVENAVESVSAMESCTDKDIELFTEIISDESSQEKVTNFTTAGKFQDKKEKIIIKPSSCSKSKHKDLHDDEGTCIDKDIDMVTEIISDESNDENGFLESKYLKDDEKTIVDNEIEIVTEIISDESNEAKEDEETSRDKDIEMVAEIISDASSEFKVSKDLKKHEETSTDKDIEMVTKIISDESSGEKESQDFKEDEEIIRDKDIEMVTEIILDESNEEKESKDHNEDVYTEIMEVCEIFDASIPKEFSKEEVPVQVSHDLNKNQKPPFTEDNSDESIKSHMSPPALKNSEDVSAEVREKNFETISKLNCENTDSDDIEYNVENKIEEITTEDENKDTEQENNEAEDENKEQNKEDRNIDENQLDIELSEETKDDLENKFDIELLEVSKEDLSKDLTENYNKSNTELSKKTKDKLENCLPKDFNKSDTEFKDDLGNDFAENSNKIHTELSKETKDESRKDLPKNSNKSYTEFAKDLIENSNKSDDELSNETENDFEKETENSNKSNTELCMETEFAESTNKSDTELSKKIDDDLQKYFTENYNKSDPELSEQTEVDLEIYLTGNSIKTNTKMLKENILKDSAVTEIPEELSNKETKVSKDNELTQESKDGDSELQAINDETIITKNSKELKIYDTEMFEISAGKCELIAEDSKTGKTEITEKSEEFITKESTNAGTEVGKESENTVSESMTKDPSIVDTEMTEESEDTESELITKDIATEVAKESEDVDCELKTKDSKNANTEFAKEPEDVVSELKTKDSEIAESELVIKDPNTVDIEMTEESEGTESKLRTKESNNDDTEIAEESEDVESVLKTKDSENDGTGIAKEAEDEESELITKHSKNTVTRIAKENEDKESELKTRDYKNSDIEVAKESGDVESELKTSDYKSSDTEIGMESEDVDSALQTKYSKNAGTAIAKESENLESELKTKDSKNAGTEITEEFKDKEPELKIKDSKNANTQMTKESDDTESELITKASNIVYTEMTEKSEITKSELIKLSQNTNTETTKQSEDVEFEHVESKDVESEHVESQSSKETTKQYRDTKCELITKDSKNVATEITKETENMACKLITKDSSTSDVEIINDSKDTKSEFETEDYKNTDAEIANKIQDTKNELKRQYLKNDDADMPNESKDTKSDFLTEDSKNSEKIDESEDKTSEKALDAKSENVDKSCHNSDNTISKEDNLIVEEKKSDLNQSSKEPLSSMLDDISMHALIFDDIDDNTDDENQKILKQICLTKRVRVLLTKLRPAELANLRQPKVKVKRINMKKSMEEFKAKRKKRISAKRAYLAIDDSSNNSSAGTTSSSDAAYRPPNKKCKLPPRRHSLRQLRTSESENDSNNSEDVNLLKISSARFKRERRLSMHIGSMQHTSSPSSSTVRSQGHHHTSSSGEAASPAAISNLIVTPRSASGLKLRISNADQSDQAVPRKKLKSSILIDDVIQLSSSSEDAGRGSNTLTPIEEDIEVDNHPLFEEEILI